MNLRNFYSVFYILLLIFSSADCFQHWWRRFFERRRLLSTEYFRLHKTHRSHMKNGVVRAVDECRRLFKYNRWNCTSPIKMRPFGNIVDLSCRETAFVYAITSAGLTYEMIKACSQGQVEGCYNTCTETRSAMYNNLQYLNKTTAVYRQCDDKVRYGVRAWENYVFHNENHLDARGLFNIRNSRLGLQQVIKTNKIVCRCHGVTGSCNLRICAQKITPYFGEIGASLYKLYESAKFIPRVTDFEFRDSRNYHFFKKKHGKDYGSRFNYNTVYRKRNAPQVRQKRNHLKGYFQDVKEMMFYDYSPDFCRKSEFASGSRGRVCEPYITGEQYNKGHRSCNELCCYGRASRTVWKKYQTNCVFKYCCQVVCENKLKKVEEYYCL